MNITKLEKLLGDINNLPKVEPYEQTIFSIGGRGYYENPASDLLAFFCDSEASHNLGSLVIGAIFQTLDQGFAFDDFSLISEVEREVSTEKGKRIDLLLEGNEWVMVIENKIYHDQDNPFDEYQTYVKSNFKEKTPIYVVLSPLGGAPIGWLSLSYPDLINSLKEKLALTFISQPLNKWLVILREFILHLETLTTGSTMPKETMSYVLNNLKEIKQAEALKKKVVKNLQQELLGLMQNDTKEAIGTKLHHWHGYPAIRFYFESWETHSDVVLFLDGREAFCINYYACDIENEKQRDDADDLLEKDDCIHKWNESSKTIRCYKAKLRGFDTETMSEDLLIKLRLINELESTIRPTW